MSDWYWLQQSITTSKVMEKKIGLCSDHAGFEMKEFVRLLLEQKGFEVIDYGCYSSERADYPDYAHKLGNSLDRSELLRGIAFCGSGNGISMALNKHKNVRAALCWDVELAELARQHNDANVLSIPARFVSEELCRTMVEIFLTTEFEGGRHEARVAKISSF